jgi:ATP-dependent DNA helicase RecG
MDLEWLRQTVAKGESESLELKKTTGDLKAGMKTLCAMLNGAGGRVIFGVTPGGKIAGQDITDPTLQEVAQEIRRLEPPAHIEQIRVPVNGGKDILILQTTTAPEAPYTYDGRPYRRIGPTTSQMPQPEYHQQLLARSHALRRWENQIAERYTLSDLDTQEIDRTVEAAIHCGRLESRASSPSDALDRLRLRVDGQLLRAAAVLFGRKFMPDYPQFTVRLARFKGTDKTEFLDHRQLHGHAFQILDESLHFILRNIPIAGRFEPGKLERQDIPLYPPPALREALVNAICHRDYSIAGGAIFVAIFDDRL